MTNQEQKQTLIVERQLLLQEKTDLMPYAFDKNKRRLVFPEVDSRIRAIDKQRKALYNQIGDIG